ncbi:Nicotinate-nucleotide pyrophosphorylase [carboxylating] [Botrimarina colliarenosi]|uniref:Probable nicotinate-nucleotide pyrophosphorylase [carboxylating] n=1 Tax=Botrimarina colliarenosi TaxID=2528001 RepID=A0A5C6AAI1_9BACT|nr:carboxylating nicotinate-nucleotide diphosphorylase [Botrimarina colliarenosi]TWT97042.1 Nicotinate-nucleotide pyrophosphorylase [carboxylating] [Botrimarina colliarenosi]
MTANFQTVEWDEALIQDCRELVRLALREDLGDAGDVTSLAVVGAERRGKAAVVSRQRGVLAGGRVATIVLEEAGADASWQPTLDDGDTLEPGSVVGTLEGAARDLLRCERVTLNLMSRLCGVATLTRRYVEAVGPSRAAVYDTRKTTPGWRRLEKHAVHCGGGHNHRTGLFDAVMIKDNHLALADQAGMTPAEAVRRAREQQPGRVIEVEVDSLDQLSGVLPAGPDIVLLDNMTLDQLREAVAVRNAGAPGVVLEASGGVRLDTIGAIATTGVDRISVGALTHSAIGLDLGLDWL